MSDLIERQAALDAIKFAELGREYDEVEKVPSVDAVPVVRCGDCKWWHEFFIRGVGRGRGVCAVHTDPLECNADWFCADGEREVQE